MGKIFGILERTFWGIASLALMLVILFAALHFLKTSNITGGTPIGAAANFVGTHAQNY